MSYSKQIDPEDLTLFAMQLLNPTETAELQAYLEQSAAGRRDLAEINGDLAVFAMSAETQVPAAGSRTRFLKQVSEEKKTIAQPAAVHTPLRQVPQAPLETTSQAEQGLHIVPVPERAQGRRGTQVLSWAGWAVAAGLAFTAGQLYRERQTLREVIASNQSALAQTTADASTARAILSALNDQTAMRVTLTRTGVAPSPTGRTTYSAEKGVLIFTASDLAPVDTYKVYELWLIPANGGAPIPAGTFHPDAKGFANLISTAMPKGVEAKAFGITVEDDGGSKVPTPPILMTGA